MKLLKIKLLLIIISLQFLSGAKTIAQKTKLIGYTPNIYGIIFHNDKILLYGEDLLWLDKNGKISARSSLILDDKVGLVLYADVDSKGNLWFIYENKLAKLFSVDSVEVVYTGNGNKEFNSLFIDDKDRIWIAEECDILKFEEGKGMEVYYKAKEKNSIYTRNALNTQNNELYFLNYNVFRLNSKKEIIPVKMKNSQFVRDIKLGKDNNIYILTDEEIFSVDNDTARTILNIFPQKNISHPPISDMAVFSKENIWIYGPKLDLWHYNGDTIVNFGDSIRSMINLKYNYSGRGKIGNYNNYRKLILDSSGNPYMYFSNGQIIGFDGNKWTLKKVYKQLAFQENCFYFTSLYTTFDESENKLICHSENGNNKTITLKLDTIYSFKASNNGQILYSSKNGIFSLNNGQNEVVVNDKGIKNFGLWNDNIIYVKESRLFIKTDSGTVQIPSEKHHLGFVHKYSVHFYDAYDGNIFITSDDRPGLIIKYDGKDFKKIIHIDGKKVGKIFGIYTYKEKSYILTKKYGIATIDDAGARWITNNKSLRLDMAIAFQLVDGSIWFKYEWYGLGTISFIRNDKIYSIDMPSIFKYKNLKCVKIIDDQTYWIYLDNVVFEYSFDE